MVKPLLELSPDAWDASAYKALLAGPGWGRAASRELWLRRFITCGLPGVMDADALYVLKGILSDEDVNLSGWVLTPHPGEFAALTGVSREEVLANPLPGLEDFCGTYRCVLVLKGHVTIIHDGEGKILIHDGMNPALGTAGSGDVLAGVIAGLLCRGMRPAAAAVCGVELHGAAGKTARETAGFFTAADLLSYISKEAWQDDEKIG
jgi:NAD(P)H-hydrate epimerase